MPVQQFNQKALLDWLLGGAAAASPGGRFLSFATGSPNDAGASDGPFTPARRTCSFAAANSPQGSATLVAAASLTASAIATVLGWNLWDAVAAGNRIAYGTFSSSVGCASGDTMGVAAGNLKITIS